MYSESSWRKKTLSSWPLTAVELQFKIVRPLLAGLFVFFVLIVSILLLSSFPSSCHQYQYRARRTGRNTRLLGNWRLAWTQSVNSTWKISRLKRWSLARELLPSTSSTRSGFWSNRVTTRTSSLTSFTNKTKLWSVSDSPQCSGQISRPVEINATFLDFLCSFLYIFFI